MAAGRSSPGPKLCRRFVVLVRFGATALPGLVGRLVEPSQRGELDEWLAEAEVASSTEVDWLLAEAEPGRVEGTEEEDVEARCEDVDVEDELRRVKPPDEEPPLKACGGDGREAGSDQLWRRLPPEAGRSGPGC